MNIETNPLTEPHVDRPTTVGWTEPGLTITRLRLVSDPGFPFWDVSYCHGTWKGEKVVVCLPFDQLPKRGMRQALYKAVQQTGCFVPGLFDSISTFS